MSTPIKPLNVHLAFAKTIFSHAAVFSKSDNKLEKEYADKLTSFITKSATIIGAGDPKSDFSNKLFSALVERNVAAFKETYPDFDEKDIDSTLIAARDMEKTNKLVSLPATKNSLPGLIALINDIRHGFNDGDDLDYAIKDLHDGLDKFAVQLNDDYPQALPSAKDTFKSMLAVWSYGSKFWNMNNACSDFAESLEGYLLNDRGDYIKVWGTDAFTSIALQHLTDPSAPLNIPAGEVAYNDPASNLPNLSSVYSHLHNVVVRDSRDTPRPTPSDPWIVMRLVNELHDRIIGNDETEFRDIKGNKIDQVSVTNFKHKFESMSNRFNGNFVSAMPLYQKVFSINDYGNAEAYEKLGM